MAEVPKGTDGDDIQHPDDSDIHRPDYDETDAIIDETDMIIDETDIDFSPSADDLVNDFDDESTLDDEENSADPEEVKEELDDLQKNSEIPLEKLLEMYNYNNSSCDQASTSQKPDNEGTSDTETGSNAGDCSHINKKSKKSSGLKYLYKEDSSTYSEEDSDYNPYELSSNKRTIMVGSNFQAQVSPGLALYENDSMPYENEDKLLWVPGILTDETVEDYLRKCKEIVDMAKKAAAALAAVKTLNNGSASTSNKPPTPIKVLPDRKCKHIVKCVFKDKHVKDNEQELHMLVLCGFDVEEALRRRRMNVILPTNDSVWSKDECRRFEEGVDEHGKNFILVQQNQVRTRSVEELVTFYYKWKKTERHDEFSRRVKFEKNRFHHNPNTVNLMDMIIDEDSTSNISKYKDSNDTDCSDDLYDEEIVSCSQTCPLRFAETEKNHRGSNIHLRGKMEHNLISGTRKLFTAELQKTSNVMTKQIPVKRNPENFSISVSGSRFKVNLKQYTRCSKHITRQKMFQLVPKNSVNMKKIPDKERGISKLAGAQKLSKLKLQKVSDQHLLSAKQLKVFKLLLRNNNTKSATTRFLLSKVTGQRIVSDKCLTLGKQLKVPKLLLNNGNTLKSTNSYSLLSKASSKRHMITDTHSMPDVQLKIAKLSLGKNNTPESVTAGSVLPNTAASCHVSDKCLVPVKYPNVAKLLVRNKNALKSACAHSLLSKVTKPWPNVSNKFSRSVKRCVTIKVSDKNNNISKSTTAQPLLSKVSTVRMNIPDNHLMPVQRCKIIQLSDKNHNSNSKSEHSVLSKINNTRQNKLRKSLMISNQCTVIKLPDKNTKPSKSASTHSVLLEKEAMQQNVLDKHLMSSNKHTVVKLASKNNNTKKSRYNKTNNCQVVKNTNVSQLNIKLKNIILKDMEKPKIFAKSNQPNEHNSHLEKYKKKEITVKGVKKLKTSHCTKVNIQNSSTSTQNKHLSKELKNLTEKSTQQNSASRSLKQDNHSLKVTNFTVKRNNRPQRTNAGTGRVCTCCVKENERKSIISVNTLSTINSALLKPALRNRPSLTMLNDLKFKNSTTSMSVSKFKPKAKQYSKPDVTNVRCTSKMNVANVRYASKLDVTSIKPNPKYVANVRHASKLDATSIKCNPKLYVANVRHASKLNTNTVKHTSKSEVGRVRYVSKSNGANVRHPLKSIVGDVRYASKSKVVKVRHSSKSNGANVRHPLKSIFGDVKYASKSEVVKVRRASKSNRDDGKHVMKPDVLNACIPSKSTITTRKRSLMPTAISNGISESVIKNVQPILKLNVTNSKSHNINSQCTSKSHVSTRSFSSKSRTSTASVASKSHFTNKKVNKMNATFTFKKLNDKKKSITKVALKMKKMMGCNLKDSKSCRANNSRINGRNRSNSNKAQKSISQHSRLNNEKFNNRIEEYSKIGNRSLRQKMRNHARNINLSNGNVNCERNLFTNSIYVQNRKKKRPLKKVNEKVLKPKRGENISRIYKTNKLALKMVINPNENRANKNLCKKSTPNINKFIRKQKLVSATGTVKKSTKKITTCTKKTPAKKKNPFTCTRIVLRGHTRKATLRKHTVPTTAAKQQHSVVYKK